MTGEHKIPKEAREFTAPTPPIDDEQFIDAAQVNAAIAATADKRVSFTPVVRDRPTVVINVDKVKSGIHGSGHDTSARQMPIIKSIAEVKGPINAADRIKKEIKNGLAENTDESKKKIAEAVLFNLRGLRTNKNLPARHFNSLQDLEDSIRLLPILQDEGDYTIYHSFDTVGDSKTESARTSKIVAIPLVGLNIADRAVDVNLEIRFVPGAFSDGNYEIVGVKMVTTEEPSILKRIGGFFANKKIK